MRQLEARRSSAPVTPPRKSTKGTMAITPEPESAQRAPTALEVAELSEVTFQDGPSLEVMSQQAETGRLDGTVLEAEEVAEPRLKAIQWLMGQFAAFGFRDEWLAEAISYMDRMAVATSHPSSSSSSSSAFYSRAASQAGCEQGVAARKVMETKDLWLAAVQIALKMSEAESELDSAIQQLIVPLVPFGQAGVKCDRARWQQILKVEMVVIQKINFNFLTATPLQLVNFITLDLCRTQKQRSGSADLWPGFESGHLPLLLGPPVKCKDLQDKRTSLALPRRPICLLQALASFLTELVVVHRPVEAYGNGQPVDVLVIAVLQLALYGFGGSPPDALQAALREIQAKLLPQERASEDMLVTMRAAVYKLWCRQPDGSPVVQKWQLRQDTVGNTIPAAPERLPVGLLSCSFSTPQRRQQDPKDATPCPPCRPHGTAEQLLDLQAKAERMRSQEAEKLVEGGVDAGPSPPETVTEVLKDDPPSSPPTTDLDTSSTSDSPAVATKPNETNDVSLHLEEADGEKSAESELTSVAPKEEAVGEKPAEAEFTSEALKVGSTGFVPEGTASQVNKGIGITNFIPIVRKSIGVKRPSSPAKQPFGKGGGLLKRRHLSVTGFQGLLSRGDTSQSAGPGEQAKCGDEDTQPKCFQVDASPISPQREQTATKAQVMVQARPLRPLAEASQTPRPESTHDVEVTQPAEVKQHALRAGASRGQGRVTRGVARPVQQKGQVQRIRHRSVPVRAASRSVSSYDATAIDSGDAAESESPSRIRRSKKRKQTTTRKAGKVAKAAPDTQLVQAAEHEQLPQAQRITPLAAFPNRSDMSRGPVTVAQPWRNKGRSLSKLRPHSSSLAQVPPISLAVVPASQPSVTKEMNECSGEEVDEEQVRSLSLSLTPGTRHKLRRQIEADQGR